jgi:tetratricopeptide (TPR) repeat protein
MYPHFFAQYQFLGQFFYSDTEDALRVKVKRVKLEKSVEWLRYEFLEQTENSALLALEWEKRRFAFRIETDLVQTELADFREELKGSKGFTWDSYRQAASFCAMHKTNLAEGLLWAEQSVQSQKNFQNLSGESMLAGELGKKALADSSMKAALALGTVMEIHQYAKSLLAGGHKNEALDVFKTNAQLHPTQFVTYVGLTRGYFAVGNYKSALMNARLALPLAPDGVNKGSVQEMIRKLEAGKDVN